MEIVFNEVCTEVLKEINIKFKSNMINVILGNNELEKKELLYLIDGLILPNSGTIQIDDITINNKSKKLNKLRKKIGLVFENVEEFFFNKTVKEELEYTTKFKNMNVDIEQVLNILKLNKEILTQNPLTLSSGEKKKIAIASVLLYDLDIILFDNPTTHLDNQSKNSLIRIFRELKRNGKTIIISSNDTDFIHKFADYIYILHNKKVVLEGKKYEVFVNENIKKYKIKIPEIIEFSNYVLEKKGIKLGYRDDIKDLIKDIYRYAK